MIEITEELFMLKQCHVKTKSNSPVYDLVTYRCSRGHEWTVPRCQGVCNSLVLPGAVFCNICCKEQMTEHGFDESDIEGFMRMLLGKWAEKHCGNIVQIEDDEIASLPPVQQEKS